MEASAPAPAAQTAQAQVEIGVLVQQKMEECVRQKTDKERGCKKRIRNGFIGGQRGREENGAGSFLGFVDEGCVDEVLSRKFVSEGFELDSPCGCRVWQSHRRPWYATQPFHPRLIVTTMTMKTTP